MFFSVITKNLNWELLTKNLVADRMVLGMKNFDIMGVSKKFIFGRSFHEKPIYRRNSPKRGAWTVCRFESWQKAGVFLRGDLYPNVHYNPLLKRKRIYIK